MIRPVMILYEDKSADGSLKEYGPHLLVRQCVADALGVDWWMLKHLVGNPRGGSGNVRNDCRRSPPQIGRDGRLVVAVYDDDRIRREVQLPANACKAQVKSLLREECAWNERLIIVFLEKNIETVIDAIRGCAPTLVDDETWKLALERKNRNARDAVLGFAANPSQSMLREQLLQRVPSLAYLIHKLAAVLSTTSDAPPPG